MKKRLVSILLILGFLLTWALPCFAAETATFNNAVYLGVVGYNTPATAKGGSIENLKNFSYYFFVDGQVETYKISPDNDFAINNMLAEGYVFDITVEYDEEHNGKVIAAGIPQPAATGAIYSFSDSSLNVAGQEIALTDNTAIYSITSQAGGALVEPAVLAVGKTIKVYGNPAEAVFLTFVAEPYQAPVAGIAGQRTLKNVLSTALNPVGTCLYVYGGTWEWQDEGVLAAGGSSSPQATNIGLHQTWLDFFQSQDENYVYRNNADPTKSYYPHMAYNQYYYAGTDCSGYMGWLVYNVANTQSGNEGYVTSARLEAKMFADKGFGSWVPSLNSESIQPADFKPGDIFSTSGHTWICLGKCEDGSLVIMHSTPSASKTGKDGGGVQISAVAPKGASTTECEAYELAKEYMAKYYPAWSQRYTPVVKTWPDYVRDSGGNTESTIGKFSWGTGEGEYLTDPDGYANRTANQILKDLFGEAGGEEYVTDRSQLASKIAEAGALTEADYTAESWQALRTALSTAEEAMAQTDLLQTDYDKALADLANALDNLVLVESGKMLVGVSVAATSPNNKPVEYLFSLRQAERLMNILIEFEVDLTVLKNNPSYETSNGFYVISDRENQDIIFTKINDNTWKGSIRLLSPNTHGSSFPGTAELLKLAFGARTLGDATLKITNIKAVALDENGKEFFLDWGYNPQSATTNIVKHVVYSIYDLNQDGAIDELDLARAQKYYQCKEGDNQWNPWNGDVQDCGRVADVNGDKVVDIADLILILRNFTK